MRQAIRAAILAGMALAGTMSAADTDTTYRILEFSDLDGWAADDHSAALSVFLETCGDLDEPDWRSLCAVARETEDDSIGVNANLFRSDICGVRMGECE